MKLCSVNGRLAARLSIMSAGYSVMVARLETSRCAVSPLSRDQRDGCIPLWTRVLSSAIATFASFDVLSLSDRFAPVWDPLQLALLPFATSPAPRHGAAIRLLKRCTFAASAKLDEYRNAAGVSKKSALPRGCGGAAATAAAAAAAALAGAMAGCSAAATAAFLSLESLFNQEFS